MTIKTGNPIPVKNWSVIRAKILKEVKSDAKETLSMSAMDFLICTNTEEKGYFVRYTKVGYNTISNNPTAEYRWVCFNTEGVRVDCDPIFESVPDENQFYRNMRSIESFPNMNDLK